MARSRIGSVALPLAPLAAFVATMRLEDVTDQLSHVLAWGGFMTFACAVPLLVPARYRRTAIWVCVAILLAAIALSILSIGVFFVPALAALVFAGITYRPD